MASKAILSCFVVILIVLPIFGRSIHQTNVNDYDQIVETSVKHILPTGMNNSVYNALVRSYWTPERMASAKPMDLLMIDKTANYQTVNYAPETATDNERTLRRLDIPGVPPKSLEASPSVVGKLFGQIDTIDYVCSGSVIVSQNGDTVLTAGHCVYDIDTDTWASDLMFVPGYSNGTTPYGSWVWRTAAVMRGWTNSHNYNYDVAVILLAPSDEPQQQHVQDLTGSLGMTVNRARQAFTDSYGYPANIHQGEELASCSDEATAAAIPVLPSYQGMRLPCNMTGGSSGGPWTQEGTYQTSVNSFGLVGETDIMYGPYFGDAVFNLWNQYQTQ